MSTNAQVLFVSRPAKGKLDPAKVFNVSRKKSKPSASDLRDGEVLVRNVVLSFDAAMRAWMGELKTYREPLALGSVMDGQAVSVVVASKSPKFSPGDKVFCMSGWQEYTVFSDSSDVGKAAEKLPSEVSLLDAQYICGGTAVTAWFGLLEVGQFKKGETVVISGAGGATGSMVGQLARAMGAGRVIGIAGGALKCSWLKKELGFDEVRWSWLSVRDVTHVPCFRPWITRWIARPLQRRWETH
jgi:NADPH-dependent curcumin reductase CurA